MEEFHVSLISDLVRAGGRAQGSTRAATSGAANQERWAARPKDPGKQRGRCPAGSEQRNDPSVGYQSCLAEYRGRETSDPQTKM